MQTVVLASALIVFANAATLFFKPHHRLRDNEVLKDVTCSDNKTTCATGDTCCKLATDVFACCPLYKAECCGDLNTCCPHGYKCDGTGHCTSGRTRSPSVTLTFNNQLQSVLCPDGEALCPDGSTCCQQPNTEWGCCALPSAVCCSDGIHCCPAGTKCDLQHGSCAAAGHLFQLPWSNKTKAKHVKRKLHEIYPETIEMCPDGRLWCPKGKKCCQQESGTYRCCPKEVAVMCPDHQHMCPDGNTCCLMSYQGQWIWGCCPHLNATCCSDGQHCCPNGYICDNIHCMCVPRGTGQAAYIKPSKLFYNKMSKSDKNVGRPTRSRP